MNSRTNGRAAALIVLRPVAAAVLSSLAAMASAQTSAPLVMVSGVQSLDSVVITASRRPQAASDVLADVSVVSRDQIERMGAGSLADLLRGTPSVQMARNGGPGGTTSLFVRGHENRFTMLLIDGVRVDSQATGGVSWEAIPLDMIERIEIVRGPTSAVYGSDAIGAVVQVFTRKAAGQSRLELALGAGSRNTRRADASLLAGSADVDLAVSAGIERSDGFNSVVNPASVYYMPDDDGYLRRTGTARFGFKLVEGHRITFGLTGEQLDAQYDGYGSNATKADDHSLHSTEVLNTGWQARWSDNFDSQLQLGQSSATYETKPSVYRTRTRARTYAWTHHLRLGQQQLDATLERREDMLLNSSLTTSAVKGEGERSQNGVAAGWSWSNGLLNLQARTRRDTDSEFGSKSTGSLAAGWQLDPEFGLHVSGSTGFRAPTLFQRFSMYGNPDLMPESSRNVEAGLRWAKADDSLGLTLYRNRVENLIVYDLTTSKYASTGRAELEGLSLQGGTRAGNTDLSASADWMLPRDEATGKLLARRAKRSATLQSDTTMGDWQFGARVMLSSLRWDNAANTKPLGGYGVVDLNAQWKFAPGWKMLMRLDNALAKDYQTALDFATQPRSVFVGVRTSLPL